jgi:PRTRC genetic system protein F
MLLSLPALDPAIPVTIIFDEPNPHHLRLASAMAAIGQITPEELASLSRDDLNYQGIKRLIDNAWSKELAALFEFEALDAYVSLHLPDRNGSDGFHEPDTDNPICSLTLNGSAQPDVFYVGRAVMTLEALELGLGHTALDILDDALRHFCHPVTPHGIYSLTCFEYWNGEKDEKAFLESWGEEAAEEDVPVRTELFDGIPEWAYGWEPRKRLSAQKFARSAKRHAKHPLGEFLGFIQQIDTLIQKHKATSGSMFLHLADDAEFDNEECFEPPAALFWARNGGDGMARILDDHGNSALQSGCMAPYQRFVRFYLDPVEIQEGLGRIRNTGLLCKALDHALVALHQWEAKQDGI